MIAKPKDPDDVAFYRHAYRWAVDALVIERMQGHRAPSPELIRGLCKYRQELRRLQNGRVHLHRSLFHD